MCETSIITNSGGGGGGGNGAKVVAVILAGSVVAYLATPTDAPPAKAVATTPASPGFPWLTISLSVLAGALLLGLVLLAYRAVRRQQREAASTRRAEMHDARRRRAIEAPRRRALPQSAKSWLGEETKVQH